MACTSPSPHTMYEPVMECLQRGFHYNQECNGQRFKNCEIWYIFNYCERIDRDMDKQMVLLDSGHQIDLEII